jgi:hypothetical protein
MYTQTAIPINNDSENGVGDDVNIHIPSPRSSPKKCRMSNVTIGNPCSLVLLLGQDVAEPHTPHKQPDSSQSRRDAFRTIKHS